MNTKKLVTSLKRGSPTILSCLGTIGVVTTVVMAVHATPKALSQIHKDSRNNHDGDPYAYTKLEAVESAAIYYIPTAVTGAATIACIFGANVLSKKQQASLTSAYALLNESFGDYKSKLKEIYGEEAHNQIIDSIAKEKTRDVYLYCPGVISDSSSLDFDGHNPEDNRLFYDSFSRRYFESTISKVLQAEYHLNRNW